jgi:hypothetical protein
MASAYPFLFSHFISNLCILLLLQRRTRVLEDAADPMTEKKHVNRDPNLPICDLHGQSQRRRPSSLVQKRSYKTKALLPARGSGELLAGAHVCPPFHTLLYIFSLSNHLSRFISSIMLIISTSDLSDATSEWTASSKADLVLPHL